jgi:hypothetical protein
MVLVVLLDSKKEEAEGNYKSGAISLQTDS